ncbi:HAF family protein [Delftia sp. GW456-R20]|uniref:hypothetical protein n=1 Tax=Delftia sp. GW456-R20 TaxID=1827145 RepID=UPI0007AECA24|nr:hypothetical protein [Delftia sp. GW456-R20]KZK32216.1 HAF family protein [Delftia sp. GW456-R20]
MRLQPKHLNFSVACLALLALPAAQALPMQDVGTSAGPQCVGLDINNSGHVVGACAESDGSSAGFVSLAPGSAADLVRLSPGRNCNAAAITNSGQVVGSCLDGNSVSVGVFWNAATPATVQTLQPLTLDVRSMPTAFNQGGYVAGVSLSGSNTARPVMWRNNETTARALPAGLLGLNSTNCVPSDVDNFVVGGNMPGIVGNCPDNSGHPRPVYWSAAVLGGYMATALNLPLNAVFCRAKTVVNTRIMGYCDFGAQGGRTVVWLNSSSSPQVLSISSPPARNSGVDLNILGEVIGHYQLADGRSMPYYWNSQTGVIRDIPPLPGGMNARVVDIGDNGTVAGHSELADGSSHAITWTPLGGTVDQGTLAGGENSAASALSQDGCYMTGRSEVAQLATHAFVQNLCTP